MTQPKTKYPSAFYAAAGVGDLVYEQLRKLQTKAVAFGNEQAPQWKRRVAHLSVKVDAGKVRESVATGTQVAAEKATKVYDTLVARGEKAFLDEKPAPAPKATTNTVPAPKATNTVPAPKATNTVPAPKATNTVPVAKKATAAPRKKTA